MQSLNPYEAPKGGAGAAPAAADLAAGWRTYFRVHFILAVSTGLLVTLNGHHLFARLPAVLPALLVVATYASLVFLFVSPLIDVYLFFKIVRGHKRCGILFIADSAVTIGHLFFISPVIS